jgi:hypothetical protein
VIVATVKSNGDVLYHPIIKYGKGVCDCGKPFIKKATNHECCSTSCLNKRYYQSKLIFTKNCTKCNKEFKTKLESKSLCKSTCGKSTYVAAKLRVFKCKGCNEEFKTNHKRSYCTKECGHTAYLLSKRSLTPTVSCECGTMFIRKQKTQKFCSRPCMLKKLNRVKNSRRRARSKKLPYQLIDPIDVFNRDGWKCNGCGIELSINDRGKSVPHAPQLDHIKPLSKGGTHTKDNVQLLCAACNINKSDHYEERGVQLVP